MNKNRYGNENADIAQFDILILPTSKSRDEFVAVALCGDELAGTGHGRTETDSVRSALESIVRSFKINVGWGYCKNIASTKYREIIDDIDLRRKWSCPSQKKKQAMHDAFYQQMGVSDNYIVITRIFIAQNPGDNS